jgi:2-oxoglutarate ferredoxin oxidoreductase subunit delta
MSERLLSRAKTFAADKGKRDLELNEVWCKACGLCVVVCPHDVLTMDPVAVKVKDFDACTFCEECERHCPDFAIRVIDHRKSS